MSASLANDSARGRAFPDRRMAAMLPCSSRASPVRPPLPGRSGPSARTAPNASPPTTSPMTACRCSRSRRARARARSRERAGPRAPSGVDAPRTIAAGVDGGQPRSIRSDRRSPARRVPSSPRRSPTAARANRGRRVRLLRVTRHDDEAGGEAAMRDRDAGERRRRDRRADAGHDLERDAGRASASASSPPRPNTNGIAAFRRTTCGRGARRESSGG